MSTSKNVINARLKSLESHLALENPILLKTVKSFRVLDKVAQRMHLMEKTDSHALEIPWWPLVSILGTFSAGKSSFVNTYLGHKLQRSGNQAVDDKFTVICYSGEANPQVLPGTALDADPRFPFYRMSEQIEAVAEGEGIKIDTYLQLKTCPSNKLLGKILIDSPGFDADRQRTSTLRITDHIVNLSDLVLVFFDARHPEPGAMRDTLDHLVSATLKRSDTSKFLFILNQIDTAAKEDNPEQVVAAWQRALGERGLTAGHFYTIYNKEVADVIADESLRQRFEKKANEDLDEINLRMEQVEVERAYRIVNTLDSDARNIRDEAVPLLSEFLARWKKRTLIADVIAFSGMIGLIIFSMVKLGYIEGTTFNKAPWMDKVTESALSLGIGILLVFLTFFFVHLVIRNLMAKSLFKSLRKRAKEIKIKGSIINAFRFSTRPVRSIFTSNPAGWGMFSKRRLNKLIQESDVYVQELNDSFTNPSGSDSVLPQTQNSNNNQSEEEYEYETVEDDTDNKTNQTKT